ncbi:hypothetical protein HYR99_11440 [Candidatus Poribacteria bacterium]|nr:hypothetical protein [Candidatus Poribacteria bacterium]
MLDVENWQRVGGPKGFQFYATDEEILQILEASLPKQYAPYSLVSSLMIPQGNTYVQDPFEFEMSQFLDYRYQGIWKFFIRSHVLTPNLPVTKGMNVDWIYSYNGLVNLQQGGLYKPPGERDRKWCASVFGVVNKLGNIHTYTVIEHKEYARVFNRLKKAIRSILCYTTITLLTDGSVEESGSILMSEGMVEKYKSGEILPLAKPGKRLERERALVRGFHFQ